MPSKIAVTVCTAEEYTAALEQLRPTLKEPVHFLQAPFYGAWQALDGKTVVYFSARSGKETMAAGLAIKYDAPGGLSFFYCPYGPIAPNWTPELYTAIKELLTSVAKQHGAAFVRLDSPGLTQLSGIKPISNKLAVTASLQPRAEWLLDIAGAQDDIWMGMHKHARYNVRLAERAEAKLELFEPGKAPLDKFFALMQTTAGRDQFSLQDQNYYRCVLSSIPADSGFVALCTIDDKPAAAAVFAAYDGVVHYVFAGSSNDFRKIAPPYFVIWNAINEARRRGWHTLNFGGITDDVKGTHLSGVTAFKKRFGGYAVNHLNPVDTITKPVHYALFRLYKTLR